ncbi:unnamed protein product, partial [Closterium sp. Yama58-4]
AFKRFSRIADRLLKLALAVASLPRRSTASALRAPRVIHPPTPSPHPHRLGPPSPLR